MRIIEGPDLASRPITAERTTRWKAAPTAILSGAIGAAAAQGFGTAFGPYFWIRVVSGGLVGAVCGLIPFSICRTKDPAFARKCLWLCVASGMTLGLLLALPVAIVAGAVALRRAEASPPTT